MQHAVDFGQRRIGILKRGIGDGDLLEDAPLGIEIAHLVMEQGVPFAFIHSRRAADHNQRRLFRKGPGDRVQLTFKPPTQ